MRVDRVRGDLESLDSFLIHNISGTTLVNEDLGHHEVCNDDGDNHEVVLVDGVDTLEVPICKVIGGKLRCSGASTKLMLMFRIAYR